MKSIAVYCSSSNKVDDIYKEEAKKVGNLLAKKEIRLVYGGGNMGLMGVLSNSAINSGGEVYGVITNHLIEIEKRNISKSLAVYQKFRVRSHPKNLINDYSYILAVSKLLPSYSYPVGLHVVDRFVKIPQWMKKASKNYWSTHALKSVMLSLIHI